MRISYISPELNPEFEALNFMREFYKRNNVHPEFETILNSEEEFELRPGIEMPVSPWEFHYEIKRPRNRKPRRPIPPPRGGSSGSSTSSPNQSQPTQQPTKFNCKKQLTLDNYESSHYRMLPRHYEPLMNFLLGLEKTPPSAGSKIAIVGHTDEQGPELMNEGLSINRALEVRRLIDHVVGKLVTQKRLLALIPTEVFARGEVDKISQSPEKNRRVEIGLCTPI
jgi:outer membrane protein OmpA-like peptidoglycan-associated protein